MFCIETIGQTNAQTSMLRD